MKVKGILVEGEDGQEYLIGFGPRARGKTNGPSMKRRDSSTGQFQPLELDNQASAAIREQLGVQSAASNHDEHVRNAALSAVNQFLADFFGASRW
jgi:hypothetical protein